MLSHYSKGQTTLEVGIIDQQFNPSEYKPSEETNAP
jgi:hypothetical protein